jgi:alkylation response protein AidB-like acyl-CoA dehydrogenase
MWYMTEERELMRNAARDFAQGELAPVALEMDAGEAFPLEQFKRAGELGFLGITMPEQYGGLGADYTTLALVYEEIAKVMPTLCVGMGAHSILAGELLMLLGSEDVQRRYLAPAATGEKILACAQTEGVGAMNHEEWSCRAVRQDDEWVINGSKVFCSNLKVADAYIVLCPTADHIDPKTKEGITAFIVDADTPGITCGAYEDKLGWHGSATGTLSFSDVHVPEANLLGMEGRGMTGLLITATNEFMTCGPVGLGMAEAAYDMAYRYSQDRIQRGKSLFDNYQVVRHMLVDMETQIETLRGFVYTAFAEKDDGKMCLARGRQMKIQGARIAQSVADNAIQIFGGLGVVRQTGVERFWRDAKVMCIGGASLEALTDDIANYMKLGVMDN